jgi:hypothetical protein
MHGHHAIPARLNDGDLYVGVRGGHGRGSLGEECDGCCAVDEGSLI